MDFVFAGINWWSNPIFKNKDGVPIVQLEDGFYSLSDPNDLDSDPYCKLKNDKVNIVNKFKDE